LEEIMSGIGGINALIAVTQLMAESANQHALEGAERQRQALPSRLDQLLSPTLADATQRDFRGMFELNGTAKDLASVDSSLSQLLHEISDIQESEQVVQDAAKSQADTVDSGGDPGPGKSAQAFMDMMGALRSPWF